MNTQNQNPEIETQPTELEVQQAENQKAINPDVEVIYLDKPLKMGSMEITQLDIRKPNVMALQGVKITDLIQGDVTAICTVIPRVSSPTLTKAQINQLEPSDLAQIGAALMLFATEFSTCINLTATVDDAIANIAVIFHWPPQTYTNMSLSELMQWHQKAIERNGNDAE